MVKEIVKDPVFLAIPSEAATAEDAGIGQDLLDTLQAHQDSCVGLAANMIGCSRRIIVISDHGRNVLMYNPAILRQSSPYDTQEGCLSLEGVRKVRRFHSISVKYLDKDFKPVIRNYMGWTAQIIQHEVDHCKGILV